MTVPALYVASPSYQVSGEGYGTEGEVRFDGNQADAAHAAPLLEIATVLIGGNNSHLAEEEGARVPSKGLD